MAAQDEAVERDGRLVSTSTAWWLDNEPDAVKKHYCVHNVALTNECVKCERTV